MIFSRQMQNLTRLLVVVDAQPTEEKMDMNALILT